MTTTEYGINRRSDLEASWRSAFDMAASSDGTMRRHYVAERDALARELDTLDTIERTMHDDSVMMAREAYAAR